MSTAYDRRRIAEYRRRADVNGSAVNGWLWRARHAIRNGRPRLALEAMRSALWLMGAGEL